MVRTLIVDDEAPARAKVRRLLESAPDVAIVGEAATGREAVAAIKRSHPDVVFLDIQMPGLDGFGVLDALQGDTPPYIVFVTADDRQAIRAFAVGAVDYLLKPFTPQRFLQVIERARDRLAASAAAAPAESGEHLRRILVLNDGRAEFILTDRIDWIESDRNYIVLHVGGAQHRLRSTIGAIAGRLDPAHFLRVNRSTIVRFDAVQSMSEWSHGDYKVLLKDGAEVSWSRRFRADADRHFAVRPR
jgi:two-component system LytT family response regulator